MAVRRLSRSLAGRRHPWPSVCWASAISAADLQRLLRLHSPQVSDRDDLQGLLQLLPDHVHEQSPREARLGHGLSRR